MQAITKLSECLYGGLDLPRKHLFVQIQQWKRQTNVWNFFKFKNKDTRTISLNYTIEVVLGSLFLTLNRFHTLFRCFHFYLQTNKYLLNLLKLTLYDGNSHHIETSPLICRTNQWTGFYMMGTFVMKELKLKFNEAASKLHSNCFWYHNNSLIYGRAIRSFI